MKLRSAYIPRPARLTLTLEGVKVLDVPLENGQARALSRAFKRVKQATTPQLHDRDVVEALVAALQLEAQQLEEGEGK